MLRAILILFLVYVGWKFMQIVFRAVIGPSGGPRAERSGKDVAKKPPVQKFHDIQDAKFEDLPPEKNKK